MAPFNFKKYLNYPLTLTPFLETFLIPSFSDFLDVLFHDFLIFLDVLLHHKILLVRIGIIGFKLVRLGVLGLPFLMKLPYLEILLSLIESYFIHVEI